MAIKISEFTDEHAQKLVRGITLMAAAHRELTERLAAADKRNAELFASNRTLQEMAVNAPTDEQWTGLLMKIGDTERGIITPNELYAYARNL